jgi:hypothetical protein
LQEKGVFPELDSGELRAVQLLIHPDKTSRDTVLETYTFTVHYTVSEDGRRTPSGLAASLSENTVATTKATNTALQQLLRNVSSLCEDLPVLPSKLIASVWRTLLTVRQLVDFCPWRSYMRTTRERGERRTSKASSLAEVMIYLLQRPRVGKLTQSLWSSQPATMSEYISAYRATIAYILPALS